MRHGEARSVGGGDASVLVCDVSSHRQVLPHLGIRGAGGQEVSGVRVPEVQVSSPRGGATCVVASRPRTAGATAGGFRGGGSDARRLQEACLLRWVFSGSRRAGTPHRGGWCPVPRQVCGERQEGQGHQGGLPQGGFHLRRTAVRRLHLLLRLRR